MTPGAIDFSHLFMSIAILCVVVGLGYIAAAIAYGIGFKDGRQDQKVEMIRQGYVQPPM